MEKEEIFHTIKTSKGISERQLIGLFPEDPTSVLDDHLEALINSGLITLFKGVYYPISRSIGLIPKGQNETVEQIELGDIPRETIEIYFTPKKDDPLFYDGYLIDESKTALFEGLDSIKFDFGNFTYYLLCQFDNSPTA